MRSVVATSFCLILASLGCSGSGEDAASKSGTAGTPKPAANSGPAAKTTKFVPLDVQSLANADRKRPDANDLSSLPAGTQRLDGVEFLVGPKMLQLGSRAFAQYPRRIDGIPVGRTFRVLHVLQSSQGGAFKRKGHPKHEEDGVNIGRYFIHYRDGGSESFPIDYGVHLRGWWNWDKSQPTPQAKIAWLGKNRVAGRYGLRVRLYHASWKNPHPEKTVTSIDFVSANAKAAPFCVAMTLEDAGEIEKGGNNEAIASNANPPPVNPTRQNPSPVNPSRQPPPRTNHSPRRRTEPPKSTASNSNPPPRRKRTATRVSKRRSPNFIGPAPRDWAVRPDPGQPFAKFPAQLPYESLGNLDQQRMLFAAGPSPFLAAGKGRGVEITSYRLIDLRTGKQVGEASGFKTKYGRGARQPVHQAISRDGRYLALYNSSANAILVGDMIAKKPVARLPYDENNVTLLFPTADRLLAVHRSHKRPAMLWELPSGKLLKRFATGDNDTPDFQQLACSPGGRFLAGSVGSGRAEEARFYDLTTGKPAGTLRIPVGGPRVKPSFSALAFSPDGKEFAALVWGVRARAFSLTHAMVVWDVASGRPTGLRVPTGGIATGTLDSSLSGEPLQWFPDGRGWLIKNRYVFDRDGGAFVQAVRVHTGMGQVSLGSKILDDRRLIVCDSDGTTKVIAVKRRLSELKKP